MASAARLYSIQGEQQAQRESNRAPASQGDVDDYVAGKSEGIINCRTGGHFFPPQSKARLEFTGWDASLGAFEREIHCKNGCGCISKVELWKRFGGKKTGRWRMIGVKRREQKNDLGETYAMPAGQGMASRRDMKESAATLALEGVTEAQLKKELGIK